MKPIGRLSLMFLGAPGTGKGTYASRIAPKLKIPTISTGDLIRDEIKSKTALGKQLAEYTTKGALVPDEVVIDMVVARLKKSDCASGYLLDGFPRTLTQALKLNSIEPLKLVVNIELLEEHLLAKIMGRRVCPCCKSNFNVANIVDEKNGVNMPPLLPKNGDATKCDCGCTLETRADDTEAIVKQRLISYHKDTAPLIGFYKKLGTLQTFTVKKGLADLPKLEELINKQIKRSI